METNRGSMKKIIVIGPALSASGYGEQTRFALRSLKSQSNAFEISGNAVIIPKTGLIELKGKELLLHGIKIIPKNAICKDNNGQWPCGESAWKALNNKLDSGPVYCKLFSDEQNPDRSPELAKCLLLSIGA